MWPLALQDSDCHRCAYGNRTHPLALAAVAPACLLNKVPETCRHSVYRCSTLSPLSSSSVPCMSHLPSSSCLFALSSSGERPPARQSALPGRGWKRERVAHCAVRWCARHGAFSAAAQRKRAAGKQLYLGQASWLEKASAGLQPERRWKWSSSLQSPHDSGFEMSL